MTKSFFDRFIALFNYTNCKTGIGSVLKICFQIPEQIVCGVRNFGLLWEHSTKRSYLKAHKKSIQNSRIAGVMHKIYNKI